MRPNFDDIILDNNGMPLSNKVLTAPNVITFCRLLLIPVFIFLRFFTAHSTAALVCYAIAASTDWVDGQVARRTGQVSRVGKLLDPVVDRALLATGVISVCVEGHLPLWIVILLVLRDVILVIEGRIQISLMGKVDSVSYIGKFATAFLMFGFGFLLLGVPVVGGLDICEVSWLPGLGADPTLFGVYLVYIGTILSITVFIKYNVVGWTAYCKQLKLVKTAS